MRFELLSLVYDGLMRHLVSIRVQPYEIACERKTLAIRRRLLSNLSVRLQRSKLSAMDADAKGQAKEVGEKKDTSA